jgi:hypothetical protein
MTAYPRLWWTTWLVALVPAVPLALFISPAPALVVAATVVGLLGGAALSDTDVMARVRPACFAAVALPLSLVPALGIWSLPIALVALATSPPVAYAVARCAPPARVTAQDRRRSAAADEVEACLDAMTGRELCAAWSESFVGVKGSSSVRERRLQAALRDSLLAELERRGPGEFAAWLHRSPSPASEPRWVLTLPTRSAGTSD